MYIYENDISAEEEIQSESTRFPRKNENSGWKKGSGIKKGKRKKSFISVGRIYVAFSSIEIYKLSLWKKSVIGSDEQ